MAAKVVRRITPLEWLQLKFGRDVPAVLERGNRGKMTEVTPAVVAPLVKERLAELVYKNGGSFRVEGWGVKQPGVGIYGEVGLDAHGAFDLMHLSGIIVGFSLAAGLDRQRVYDDVSGVLKVIWREKGWTDEL